MSLGNKKLSISEFRAMGLIFEINRLLLHPLGLALSGAIDEKTGEEVLDCIWDCRDDPEGIIFDEEAWKRGCQKIRDSNPGRVDVFVERHRCLGFIFQGGGIPFGPKMNDNHKERDGNNH